MSLDPSLVVYQIDSDPSFSRFANDAYASDGGYAIRRSPITGETEMFVRGTNSAGDWARNYLDYRYTPLLDRDRRRMVRDLSEVAAERGVSRVYGHSRGAALVSDMALADGVERVGLDGATSIAHYTPESMVNLVKDEYFDRAISTDRPNRYVDPDRDTRYHNFWTDRGQFGSTVSVDRESGSRRRCWNSGASGGVRCYDI